VISLLLNRVTLTRGEALYLPAGNIHAYLDGLGVELMAASDNVLRGGLTPKHIDVPELVGVLDFTPVPVPYLRAVAPAAGVEVFVPDVPDFVLVRVSGTDLDAGYTLTGPGIAICTSGEMSIEGAASSVTVGRGESVYVTPDEASLRFSGSGELFLATTGE
jgi:mannose-6-phosphate isomerase